MSDGAVHSLMQTKEKRDAQIALIGPLLLQQSAWEWALCGLSMLPPAFCMC